MLTFLQDGGGFTEKGRDVFVRYISCVIHNIGKHAMYVGKFVIKAAWWTFRLDSCVVSALRNYSKQNTKLSKNYQTSYREVCQIRNTHRIREEKNTS